ncbi:hypothetical protein [Actinokineospora xionganensis]|uniref:Uncharacterized protein n=1 Tax=Actinokineospora xionganensis TaxID=2684470 RepID=A0ABR7LAS1_9PSEU|nr:hypothetical protein [Actinokineospora xionganensis]MBC6449464.1 hypothetical protein [Actinokineospora xionganensis]
MGVYVSVRGWLECDDKQFEAIRAIIAAHEDGHYSGGWGRPGRPVGWAKYVFYCADIRWQAVGWFLGQVREIARIPPSNDDNDLVRGLFFLSHEIEGMSEWQVRGGEVHITAGDERHRYLDE